MKKRAPLLVLILLLLLSVTGCWGMNQINDLAIVLMTGVDLEPNGDTRVTVLAVMPVGGGAMGQLQRSSEWLGTATGKTAAEAFRNIIRTAPKRIVWFHNKTIIVGEGLARSGLDGFMDFYARNRETRFKSHILVADGTALEFMQTPPDISKNLSDEVEGMITRVQLRSMAYVPHLKDFLINLSSPGMGGVTGHAGSISSNIKTYSTAREFDNRANASNSLSKISDVNGAAVFNGDKLVGWLNGYETRGYLWMVNKVKSAVVVCKCNDASGMVSLEVSNAKAKLTPEMEDGELSLNIQLKVKGALFEQTGTQDLTDNDVLKVLEDALAREITDEMKAAMTKAQIDYSTDFIGIGRSIYQRNPKQWKNIREDWSTVFSKAKVKYDVKVTIVRFGEITSNFTNVQL